MENQLTKIITGVIQRFLALRTAKANQISTLMVRGSL